MTDYKILSKIKRLILRYSERARSQTSALCLGVSISLFFSLFVQQGYPTFYVDLACGEFVPLGYLGEDDMLYRALCSAVLYVLSIIIKSPNKKE